jgi:hypothetical protein
VAPVLKKCEVISVEEDLALTMEAAAVTDPHIKKVAAPKAKTKKRKKGKKGNESQQEDLEELKVRWEKLRALATRRTRILERKAERLRPCETVPTDVIQDLQQRIRTLNGHLDRGEKEYTTGHPKIAIRTLVSVHDTAKELREQLSELPSEASSDSMDMEIGWVKVLHQSWSQMLEEHVIELEWPLNQLCLPLTEALDQLLMSSTIEELHEHRDKAIKASSRVEQDVRGCRFYSELESHPDQPLVARTGLFPTLERVMGSLEL